MEHIKLFEDYKNSSGNKVIIEEIFEDFGIKEDDGWSIIFKSPTSSYFTLNGPGEFHLRIPDSYVVEAVEFEDFGVTGSNLNLHCYKK